MDVYFTCSYTVAATVASILYGVRGFLIARDWGVPRYELIHQTWFNAACSMMGWAAGYWVLGRFVQDNQPHSIIDIVILVFAALGIVGYLPQTLNAMPGLLRYLGQLLEKKIAPSSEHAGRQ